MSDFEKHRIQTDARRAVARRRVGSVVAEQATLRHLGIELYRERRQAERLAGEAAQRAESKDEGSADDSADR
jgi:hypothetical protein